MFRRETEQDMTVPYKCALCMGSTTPMVDTLRQNAVNTAHELRGKQYVCALCMEALGEAWGFPTQAELESAERKTAYWRRKAQKEADVLANLREIFKDENGEPLPEE